MGTKRRIDPDRLRGQPCLLLGDKFYVNVNRVAFNAGLSVPEARARLKAAGRKIILIRASGFYCEVTEGLTV